MNSTNALSCVIVNRSLTHNNLDPSRLPRSSCELKLLWAPFTVTVHFYKLLKLKRTLVGQHKDLQGREIAGEECVRGSAQYFGQFVVFWHAAQVQESS